MIMHVRQGVTRWWIRPQFLGYLRVHAVFVGIAMAVHGMRTRRFDASTEKSALPRRPRAPWAARDAPHGPGSRTAQQERTCPALRLLWGVVDVSSVELRSPEDFFISTTRFAEKSRSTHTIRENARHARPDSAATDPALGWASRHARDAQARAVKAHDDS